MLDLNYVCACAGSDLFTGPDLLTKEEETYLAACSKGDAESVRMLVEA
eukprot:SAG31_NODE_43067_length_268_cov_1.822485_1_plen_47_part_10